LDEAKTQVKRTILHRLFGAVSGVGEAVNVLKIELVIEQSSNSAVKKEAMRILDEVREYISYPVFVRGCDPEKLLELRKRMGNFISRNYPKGNTLY